MARKKEVKKKEAKKEGDNDAPQLAHGIRLKVFGQEIEITGRFPIAVVAGLIVIILVALWADPDLRETAIRLITGNGGDVTNGGDDNGGELPQACRGLTKEACDLYCQRYPSKC